AREQLLPAMFRLMFHPLQPIKVSVPHFSPSREQDKMLRRFARNLLRCATAEVIPAYKSGFTKALLHFRRQRPTGFSVSISAVATPLSTPSLRPARKTCISNRF